MKLLKLNDTKNFFTLISEMNFAISQILSVNETKCQNYLKTNVDHFVNFLLLDENSCVLRNLSLKISENERLYPITHFYLNKKQKNLLTNLFNEMKQKV